MDTAGEAAINMSCHSKTGPGFGYVEAMAVELDRLASSFARAPGSWSSTGTPNY
ncbi:hypothetical protein [Streptomyces acidiscabies]|uniref:hypothetical protein n=1 Tax=Streptomyces acidiscabies TaxID=42234 RepID=UPI003BAF8E3B